MSPDDTSIPQFSDTIVYVDESGNHGLTGWGKCCFHEKQRAPRNPEPDADWDNPCPQEKMHQPLLTCKHK